MSSSPPSSSPTPNTSPLSLHDALPICFNSTVYLANAETMSKPGAVVTLDVSLVNGRELDQDESPIAPVWVELAAVRSEEHTSELQSLRHLVCRLLLEKKNINIGDMNCI